MARAAAKSPASGIEDQLEAQVGQLLPGEQGRAAALDHVGHRRLGDAAADLGQLLQRAGRLDETGVGAGPAGLLDAGDRLVQPFDGQGVGPGDDEEVPLGAGFHGRADLLHVLLPRHDPLAPHVPAPLGPDLILEEAAGRAGRDQLSDRAVDVQRIAVAGVGVDDDRDRHAHGDPPRPLDHLGLREQPQIGLADRRGGHRVAGDEAHGKAAALAKPGGKRVEDAGEGDRPHLIQDPLYSGCRHGWYPRATWEEWVPCPRLSWA